MMENLDMNAAPEGTLYESLIKKIDFDIDKDYLEFIKKNDGGEGFIGEDDFIAFWNIDDLVALNPYYEDVKEVEHLFFFASNGSNFGYAFDKHNGNVVGIDYHDVYDNRPQVFGPSFKAFLNALTEKNNR